VGLGSIGSAGAAAEKTSALDTQWLKTSIQGDRFEIAGGKMAQQTSQTPAVQSLGQRLVTDHTQSLKDATAEAKRLGMKVPDSPTNAQQWELDQLEGMSGSEFDAAYSSLEVADHKDDIEEATSEQSDGSDPAVTKLAQQDLPVLREHLQLSQAAQSSSSSGNGPSGGSSTSLPLPSTPPSTGAPLSPPTTSSGT